MAAEKKNPFEKLAKSSEEGVEEVVVDAEEVVEAVEAEAAPEKAEKPAAPKSTRRTAKQVEEEAAAREAALQEQIDALKSALEKKADVADIGVVQDRVVLEGGVGGDVRVVGNGRTLANDDWRATVDGLRLLLGRASSQSTQQFQLPVTLVPSLAELLSNLAEIQE